MTILGCVDAKGAIMTYELNNIYNTDSYKQIAQNRLNNIDADGTNIIIYILTLLTTALCFAII